MIFRNCVRVFLFFHFLTFNLTAAELDTITIPKDCALGGRAVQAGVYQVEIDETAQQPYLRLIQNQKLIASDLAIVLPARGSGTTTVQLTKIAGKELIRIRARHGEKWYFAYLETSR